MPPLLLGTLLSIGLLLLSAALGSRLLRVLCLETADPAERFLCSAGLGLGTLQFIPFTLFALGLGHPLIIRLTVAALALVLTPDLLAVLRDLRRWLRLERRLSWWEWFLLPVLLLLLGAIYLRAICPVTDIDGLGYHLTAALRFLKAERFVYLPTLTFSNWPLGVESLFALVLAIHPEAPVGLVPFLMGVLTLGGVYLHARRLGGSFAGAVACCLLLLSMAFWWEMATAYIDVGTALFGTLAVFSFGRAMEGSAPSLPWMRLSALCAGLVATTKLNCLPVLGIFPLLILLGHQGEWRDRLRRAVAFGLIAACLVVPWFVRTWVLTGNPVYPASFEFFGGREWTADGWARLHEVHLMYNAPSGPKPSAALLFEIHALIASCAVAVTLLVLVLTRVSPVSGPARFGILFATAILIASYYNPRFLLPAHTSGAICGAYLMRRWERWAAPGVCAFALLLALYVGWKKVDPDLGTAFQVACGRLSREDYLHRRLVDYPVAEFANQNCPPDTRILLSMFAPNTALYRSEALSANYWLQDSIHYDSHLHLETDLRRLGIDYLVLDPNYPGWCHASYIHRPRCDIELPALSALARERGVKLFEANGVSLYRLQWPLGSKK